MSTLAFRRSRSPIRGSEGSSSSDAKCRAGQTNALRERETVTRIAWSIFPGRASSGRIGSPAASAEVQPRGRAFGRRRFQTAPEPACQRPSSLPEREQLVEPAAAAVDEQRVAVAAALDLHAARDRVADAIALATRSRR